MNIKTDECIELKNLQYKTMLSGGSFNIETNVSDVNLLDKFLEDNKLHNLNDNWAKMDNTNKIKKFNNFFSNRNPPFVIIISSVTLFSGTIKIFFRKL